MYIYTNTEQNKDKISNKQNAASLKMLAQATSIHFNNWFYKYLIDN